MFVLLFDIDGTLVHTGGAGTAALKSAVRDAFGISDPHDVPVSGRTDRGIARNLFQAHGLEDTEENWNRFRSAYLRHLEDQLPQRLGRVLPGVEPLLEALAQRTDVFVGLLTGNVRDGARLKLEHYAISHHFSFGGFGDRFADRDDVAAEALEASHAHAHRHGKQVTTDRVWVIGDTPFDVTCARAIQARVVAVATGSFPREALAEYSPDLLLDSLSDHGAVVDALLTP